MSPLTLFRLHSLGGSGTPKPELLTRRISPRFSGFFLLVGPALAAPSWSADAKIAAKPYTNHAAIRSRASSTPSFETAENNCAETPSPGDDSSFRTSASCFFAAP